MIKFGMRNAEYPAPPNYSAFRIPNSALFIIFADMKNLTRSLFRISHSAFRIICAVLALLCACGDKDLGGDVAGNVSPALADIDSMMWRQPDSAFVMLQAFASSPSADSLGEFDGHYLHLLLSELLYKNDYAQTNRGELLRAVEYFDSLHVNKDSDILAFLDARSHYIKGVGYYETDSVVEACGEYFKALEAMEGNHREKELIGIKANFMAMSFTRLEQLYSDFYLHEPALYFGEMALYYYYMHDAEPLHVAWVLDEIGMQHYMMDHDDSAYYYYKKVLFCLPDTNVLAFRDTKSQLALLSYKNGASTETVLHQLDILTNLSESEGEKLTRQAIMGEICYREALFDSAWVHLNGVFHKTDNLELKKQVAEWLVEICRTQGKDLEILEYAGFLVPYANLEKNQSERKSGLTELYKNYVISKNERQLQTDKDNALKRWRSVLGYSLIVLLITSILLFNYKKKKNRLERQLVEEQYCHEIQQKAVLGRLKKSNENLRKTVEQLKNESDKVPPQQPGKEISYKAFLDEPICKAIIDTVHQQQFKSKIDHIIYKSHALRKNQTKALRVAADKTLDNFTKRIRKQYPKLTDEDVTYCCLYLLGLSEADVSALMQKAYTTVCERKRKIRRILGEEGDIATILQKIIVTT